ncbi:MAG: CHASE2 domain-containing protein [Bacteroidales bacterium]|nr:CHASE2 domain-containing protein [Bacteroidales bacterium]
MKHYPLDLKRDSLNGLLITGIIVLITVLLMLVGLSTSVFDPVGQAMDDFRISDGLFYSRALRVGKSDNVNPGVVIVDIAECDSREEIAALVDRINHSSPKLLAVDIIFGRTPSISSESDSALVAAFSYSPNLILASRFVEDANGGHFERSFFADDVCCQEGDVSFELGKVRDFSPFSVHTEQKYPTMVARIAGTGNIAEGFPRQLINYTPVNTVRVTPETLGDGSILKDQIVILGDMGDYRDYHDIPVMIDGQARTSGINILAQCLYSLQPGNGFKNCPHWLEVLLGILLTYLFCTFLGSPLYRIERFNGLWISIFQILTVIVLLAINFVVFWYFRLNVSLVYWFIGVGLSGLATELFYFIVRRHEKTD